MNNRNKNFKVFLAGSTGAVGIVLCRLLSEKGYSVFGMTRRKEKMKLLASLNIQPVVLNVYEKDSLEKVLEEIQPKIIIHQLTDLPFGLPEEKMDEGLVNNQRIRDVGTRNLVSAAKKIFAERFIAQSIAFMYEMGKKPYQENNKLSSPSLTKFENQILHEEFIGIILRYGRFYGPNTGFTNIEEKCKVHVDAAAYAAMLAIENGSKGIYNITEDDGEVSISKAVKELNWNPMFRLY